MAMLPRTLNRLLFGRLILETVTMFISLNTQSQTRALFVGILLLLASQALHGLEPPVNKVSKANVDNIVKTICSVADLYNHVPKGKTRVDVPILAKDQLVALCAYSSEDIGAAADELNKALEKEPAQTCIVFRLFLLLAYNFERDFMVKPLLCWPSGSPGETEPEQVNPWHQVGTHEWQVYPVSWRIMGDNIMPRSNWQDFNQFPQRQSPGFWSSAGQILGEDQVLLQAFRNCPQEKVSKIQKLIMDEFLDFTMKCSNLNGKTVDVFFFINRKAFYANKKIDRLLDRFDQLVRVVPKRTLTNPNQP